MASYSVLNKSLQVVLDIDYECFSEFQPACNFIIRPLPSKAQPLSRAIAQVYVPTYLIVQMIQNLSNPQLPCISVTYTSGTTQIGRQENAFIISGINGSAQIALQESQWNDTIEYLKLIYQFGPLAKVIGKTTRLHIINVLRQLGLDVSSKDTYGNDRYLTTQYWDKDAGKNNNMNIIDIIADKVANKILMRMNNTNNNSNSVMGNNQLNNNISNNSNSNNFTRSYVDSTTSTMQSVNPVGYNNNNVINPAPIGIPQGMVMPPLPPQPPIQQGVNNNQTLLDNNKPLSTPNPVNIPMPPLPQGMDNGDGGMVSGIQDMLKDAFK